MTAWVPCLIAASLHSTALLANCTANHADWSHMQHWHWLAWAVARRLILADIKSMPDRLLLCCGRMANDLLATPGPSRTQKENLSYWQKNRRTLVSNPPDPSYLCHNFIRSCMAERHPAHQQRLPFVIQSPCLSPGINAA